MSVRTQVTRPPPKPVLIFDGDCQFCRRWIERWRATTGDRVEYIPLQADRIATQFPELRREQLESAVHLVAPDGQVYRAAEAVFSSLACIRRWPLWIYQRIPGAAPISEAGYRLVAANRTFFSFITRLFWGDHLEPPTHFLVRWLFLRLIGVVYLVAFGSLGSQIVGLAGSNGIVPANQVMSAINQTTAGLGLDRFRLEPTLCWFSTEDRFLHALCITGIILSVLLILNFAPAPCLFLLWLIYLSLATVCTVFLGYQWDNLLLEAGFLAIFFAPARLWPNLPREAPPARAALWLLRWLIFRLTFASGCVKLLSGDETWRNLTALTVHYETQPLPTPLGWYVHQLPEWFQKISCGMMFGIELVVPFFIFLPRRPRFVAFWLFLLLQVGIAFTGNYTFFNLLTVVLCVPLLDDQALLHFAPQKWLERVRAGAYPPWLRRWPLPLRLARGLLLSVVLAVFLAVTTVEMLGMFRYRWSNESPLVKVYRWVAPLRSINGYGLFAVMTISRPEIIVEGSNDGLTWLPYEFKHKPGNLKRRPTFVAPHQPRLDWQMWFAALSDVQSNPWFVNFCLRLLQGKPEVLALLENNPFPEKPPKYIRASVYDYHFTTSAERKATGAWWKRGQGREYLRPISLSANN